MTTPHSSQATPAAIAFLVASSACFVSLDLSAQALVGAAAAGVVSVWLVVFARYAVQALATAVVLLPRRGMAAFTTAHPKFQLMRGALLTATSLLGMMGLKHMPVAEFTAIVMLTPLVVTVLAVRFLREHMRPIQWLFLVASLAGALVVARPSGAVFGWWLLYPVASLCCYSVFQLLTRRLAQTEDPLVMHLYTGLVGTATMSLALPWAWAPLTGSQLALLVSVGVWGTVGHYLLIQAFKRAPASALAPFLYVQVLLAVVGGWLIFSRVPDAVTFLGIGLIVLGGVASAWAQTRR